jgi:segregation and condensation protein B
VGEPTAGDASADVSADGPADVSADSDLRDVELSPADPRTATQAAAGVTGEEARAQAQGPGPGDLLTDDEILRSVTALVFASPEPIGLRRIVELLERPDPTRVEAALGVLKDRLAQAGLPLELRAIAGGYQILTTPEMGTTIQRLFQSRRTERISSAALETMAVVAYRQPVTKAEIEAIRGVQAGPILRTLVERGLVRVLGRSDVPGHPLQYGTTRDFLDRFGLGSLEELPRDAELTKD